MKIKMLKNERGSIDGLSVQNFISDQVYDVSQSLADVFVNTLKVAVFYQDEIIEQKMIMSAPENKIADAEVVENKDEIKKRGRK